MSKIDRHKALEIIRSANEKRQVQVDFNITIDGVDIPVTMKNIDLIKVSQIQQMALEKALYECRKDNLHLLPINEERWQQHLERATQNLRGKIKKEVLRRMEKEKPKNLAEQIALEISWYETGRKYIPQILYCGDYLLFDESNIDDYYKIIKDMDLLTLLVNKFAELRTLQFEVEDAAKNSTATASLN